MKLIQKKTIQRVLTLLNFILLVTGTFSHYDIFADQLAKTKEGKTVLLKNNGTWEYVEIDSKTNKITPFNSSQTESSLGTTGTSPTNNNVKKESVTFSNKEMASIADELNIKEEADFRNVNWGMTLQQVKMNEKLQLINSDNQLLEYEYTLIGMRCKVLYYFSSNSLTKAQYKLNRKHYDPSNFNKDYTALKQYLIRLYGDPNIDQDNWHNDQYKSDPTKWGFAVSIGFLTRTAVWKNGRSKILLEMLGENHKAFINIKYTSLDIYK